MWASGTSDDTLKGRSSCSDESAGWAAAAGADSRGHCVPRLVPRQASENRVFGSLVIR